MEKKNYIQPLSETTVLPKDVLMQDPNPASGGSFPGGFPVNPARRYVPNVNTGDSVVAVF